MSNFGEVIPYFDFLRVAKWLLSFFMQREGVFGGENHKISFIMMSVCSSSPNLKICLSNSTKPFFL